MERLATKNVTKLAAFAFAIALSLSMLAGCSNNSGVNEGEIETENIQEQLDNEVAQGMLNISIASVIQFENGTSEGYANIENIEENRYNVQVTITLDSEDQTESALNSTGEQLYQSPMLEPGTTISNIRLDKVLEKGEYPATAHFVAYDPETGNEEGQANAQIEIDILN